MNQVLACFAKFKVLRVSVDQSITASPLHHSADTSHKTSREGLIAMSFFARRAKPKPESSTATDATRNLFSHSGSFLTQQKERIEREKREAEKEQQRRAEKERRHSIKRENPQASETDRKGNLKRRRISSKESEKLLAIAGLPSGPIELDSSDNDADQSSPALPVRRSPRHVRTTTDDYGLSKTRSSRLDHIAAVPIEHLEDDVEVMGSAAVLPVPCSSDGEDEFSDPELAELSRKARRAARARQSQEKKAISSGANSAGEALDARTDSRARHTPEAHDPVVQIFITSDIPNTGSLLIRRKMSQPIGRVRIAWCDRYNLPNRLRDEVFLTFCGRRQYDSTTCQRLGLRVDAHGKTVREDGDLDEPHDQVHVEAFTEALFAERQAEKARQAKADSGNYDVDEEVGEEPEQKKIKILVRIKDKQPAKLLVSPVGRYVRSAWFRLTTVPA